MEMAVLCEKCIKTIEKRASNKTAKENLEKSKKLSKSTKSSERKEGKKLKQKTEKKVKKEVARTSKKLSDKAHSTIFVVGTKASVNKKTDRGLKRSTRVADRVNGVSKKITRVQERIEKAKLRIKAYEEKITQLQQKGQGYSDKLNNSTKTPIVIAGLNMRNIEKLSKQKVTHFGVDGDGTQLVKVDGKWYQSTLTNVGETMKLLERGGKITEKKARRSNLRKIVEE